VIHLPGGYQQLIEEPSEARITAHERPSSAVIRLIHKGAPVRVYPPASQTTR